MPQLVSIEEAARWCEIHPAPVGNDLALFTQIVDAVEAHILATYTLPRAASDPDTPDVPGALIITADIKQAVLMQVARMRKRQETPEGIATFDAYALRVSRLDPDIDELMTPYSWGFA